MRAPFGDMAGSHTTGGDEIARHIQSGTRSVVKDRQRLHLIVDSKTQRRPLSAVPFGDVICGDDSGRGEPTPDE